MTINMTNIISGIKAAKLENLTSKFTEHNVTDAMDLHVSNSDSTYPGKLIYSFILFLCIPGIIGNGIVIGHLCFRMKRNYFDLYILNLALADSGLLILIFLSRILDINNWYYTELIRECLICTYCAGRYFLIIICMDRCLVLFSPIRYQSHQLPCLSTILCTITWIVSFLISAIHYTMSFFIWPPIIFNIIICTSVCFPLMVVSSLALFIKGSLKPQMQRREQLLLTILLALFFFLILSIPTSAIYLFDVLFIWNYFNLIAYIYLFVCLNSSVNPLICFLLGREKEHTSMHNLKICKEEEKNDKQPEVQVDI
ncbi:mas-related G-protein coupled receptor member X1-like [Pantherophis guttatus]|uniref:Mas-related G-protein coupled receptor member X1-like n=1 Tax=Pantherophis guttatus TaxID=94885 RepID=A0A6P9DI40_PANGU|nr:mas-related G-protein coupled receptor member X1-like [Pantherophis guttatus]XP_060537666.1 mas-related G-protein coupled receptor member X1-like [Pantherophis guttatus]XP_060540955.1 mas-related G-protein coupled receptor member X1-like [Pantherophis guttatus]